MYATQGKGPEVRAVSSAVRPVSAKTGRLHNVTESAVLMLNGRVLTASVPAAALV